jgi:hypothetical protein
MWVHSLWTLITGQVDELSLSLAQGPFEGADRTLIQAGVMLHRLDAFADSPDSSSWIQVPVVEAKELAGLYVLDPPSLGFPAAQGRVLVGVASPRPASNQVLASRITAQRNASALLPVLSKRALLELKGLTLYEARTESDDREVSVTYLDPLRTGVLDEWPDDGTEFAAATLTWEGHLLTVFADGQLWLDDVPPEQVPFAVQEIGRNLWSVRQAANVVY